MNYFIKINGLRKYLVQSPNPRFVLRVAWLNWPQLARQVQAWRSLTAFKQDVDQVRRRHGRHDAGQRRRSRAAARAEDPGRARTWSPRRAGAGRCSSWPARCRSGDRSPPSSRTSTRCGAGAAGMLLASGADRALQPGLRILAARAPGRRGAPAPAAAAAGPPGAPWRSLTASSRPSTRCGAGAAGTMLASGADRALQPGLRILAACAPGCPGTPAACCS
jgi:hypothetical protein